MGTQEESGSGRVDLKVKQHETGINKVNPKSVMTFGVQLACIWNRAPSVFPGKDEMPPGIFLKNFSLKMRELLYPECTGIMNALTACAVSHSSLGTPLYPCAAAEMSLGWGRSCLWHEELDKCGRIKLPGNPVALGE